MSNFNKKLFKRLKLNRAYGQLIALIFVPIMILSCVGAGLVLSETANSAKNQQRSAALAILSRYKHTAEQLILRVDLDPAYHDRASTILQGLFNERYLLSAAIIDQKNTVHLSIGAQSSTKWPTPPPQQHNFFGT